MLSCKLGKLPTICVVILLCVTACSVGPDFETPDIESPEAWYGGSKKEDSKKQDQKSIAVQEPNPIIEWWTLFEDPLLSSLVKRAVESNLDLQKAEARIREARAAKGIVQADYYPWINNAGGFRRSDAGPANIGSSEALSEQKRNIHNVFDKGFDASWEIDIFGGTRRSVEVANANIDSAIEDLRDIQISVMAEVAKNYIKLRGLQKEIEVEKKNLALQEKSLALSKEKFESGFVSALDVHNAEAQLMTTQSQIPSLESAAQQVIFNISILLGLKPSALVEELSSPKNIPLIPQEVAIGLPSELLERRPDIRRAMADLHAATAEIGVAVADLYPKFSISGALGIQSATLRSFTRWTSRFWNFEGQVLTPFFQGGALRAKIDVQNAIQEQALVNLKKTMLLALQEVESALIAYSEEQKRLEALDVAVNANRLAVDLAMKLYAAGETDFLNVLSAQRQLLASEDALAQSEQAVATNLVALYKALGGGWEEP